MAYDGSFNGNLIGTLVIYLHGDNSHLYTIRIHVGFQGRFIWLPY